MMMRWLHRFLSDRGGQHAEAGVLMATVVLLGGLVAAGSMPELGSTVAEQWKCQISARDSAACQGDQTSGNPSGKGRQLTATTKSSTTEAGYTDPGESHFPQTPDNADFAGRYEVAGVGLVDMSSCTATSCIGQDGTFYECDVRSTSGPFGTPLTVRTCSIDITASSGLECLNVGLSVYWDTCDGPSGIVHCSDNSPGGKKHCVAADNDADASIPGGQPVSCGELTGDSATCLGSNGTLYQCIDINKLDQCLGGGRNLSPDDPALDCPDQDPAKDRTIRCTYTPATCNPEPAEGTCADQAVSVECLIDPPSDPNIEYQHCQSLGQVVPDGSGLTTVCVEQTAVACEESLTTQVSAVPENYIEQQIGPVTVQIDPAAETTIWVDGKRETMNVAELTDFCNDTPEKCDRIITATADAPSNDLATYFKSLGVCTTDCPEFVGRLAAAGGTVPGPTGPGRRPLTNDVGDNVVAISAGGLALVSAGLLTANAFTTNGTTLTQVGLSIGTAGAAAYLAGAIRTDLTGPATDSAIRRGGGAAQAAAIAAAGHARTATNEVIAAARRGGATAATWAGDTAADAAAGGRALQDRIVNRIAALTRAARQAGQTASGSGDVEMGRTGA